MQSCCFGAGGRWSCAAFQSLFFNCPSEWEGGAIDENGRRPPSGARRLSQYGFRIILRCACVCVCFCDDCFVFGVGFVPTVHNQAIVLSRLHTETKSLCHRAGGERVSSAERFSVVGCFYRTWPSLLHGRRKEWRAISSRSDIRHRLYVFFFFLRVCVCIALFFFAGFVFCVEPDDRDFVALTRCDGTTRVDKKTNKQKQETLAEKDCFVLLLLGCHLPVKEKIYKERHEHTYGGGPKRSFPLWL